ncbi:MAG: radical SAM/SPASM domain-containing protein, partial [Deltaproteobacteria bacterium]|nr:radical SAM/SPASM domain-containing protein [Deltaproteobacteria bacterium]
MLKDFLKQIFQPNPPSRFDVIQVEVSALCNASCPYCVHGCYGEIWGGGLMEMDTFRRLKGSFGSSNLVFLQGWGEPLLHP